MNWKRPTRLVKVKKYPKGIIVDKCCAEMVKKIDSLPDIKTAWSCCNHGLYKNKKGIAVGGVEFFSKLPSKELKKLGKVTICTWEKNRYNIEIKCKCPPKVIKAAKKHFENAQAKKRDT